MKRNVNVAKTAGFCFGVQRAVDLLEASINQGESMSTLGPLIHNPQVVEGFAKRGVTIIDDPAQAEQGRTVMIRAHGVGEKVYAYLKENEIPYTDATCPFVTKIHNIVKEASDQGKVVLIAGDKEHPEVQGIIGHCTDERLAVPFASSQELKGIIAKHIDSSEKAYILVAQTTFNLWEWQKCVEIAENVYTNLIRFDTICNATMLRQEEAAELARESDMMVVIGGRGSSNTAKLVQICQSCGQTVLVETARELAEHDLSGAINIGVTAGASTPAFIIKEVQKTMSETTNMQDELSFEEMLEASFKTINSREKVTAVVTSVSPTEIAVDIGTKHAGYVPFNEYTDDPAANLEELVKVGDEIELMVLRISDMDGTATLSKKRLDAIAGFEKIVEAQEADEILEGVVVDVVKGGVIALANGVRVFIPASQATISRNQDLQTLVKQTVNFKILETNRQRRRAVGSIRAVLKEQRKELEEKFWQDVEAGRTYQGTVKSLTSYGAFVDLGGVDGMVHISELSWSRIKHPSEIVNVDDIVEVYVKDIDTENKKISLGYKKTEDNPWEVLKRDYAPGAVAKVKIVSMTPFGAFAQVIPGVDGLIHISQISNERIGKPADVLAIGQEVDVRITEVDFDKKRVSLSIRALLEPEASAEDEKAAEDEAPLIYEAAPPAEEVAAPVEAEKESTDAE